MSDGQFTTEWAEFLKPGDTVMVDIGTSRITWQLRTVERTTKTQIIMKRGSRFRKSDGKEVGGGLFHDLRIVPVTNERLAQYRRRVRLSKLSHIKWDECSDETLARVLEIVTADQAPKEPK